MSVPAFTVANGFTVAVTMIGVPSHPFDAGVMVYTTVPTDVFVTDNTCEINAPVPSDAPRTFALGAAVHENVVAKTFAGNPVIKIEAVSPLQITTPVAEAVGTGFTVTMKSTVGPSQPLLCGVIL